MLVSSKACFGHTEGTAGITGLLLSISVMQQGATPPVANLRSINPYVEAAMGSEADKQSTRAMLALRQAAPAEPRFDIQEGAASNVLAGCSSFGMSGVNAHIITTQYGQVPVSEGNDHVRKIAQPTCIACITESYV